MCTARPAGEAHGNLRISRAAGQWRVSGRHGGLKVNVRITPAAGNAAPVVTV